MTVPPISLSVSALLRIREDVSWEPLDDEVVAWNDADRSLHRLSGTGALIVKCLDGRSSVDDVSGRLANAFGAPLEQVHSDVHDFCLHLMHLGLLEANR